MKKRWIAWLLTAAMVVGQVPATALAGELEPETEIAEETAAVVEETEEVTETVAEKEEAPAAETVEETPALDAAGDSGDEECAPKNLTWDGYTLSWDAVEGADGYVLMIESVDYLGYEKETYSVVTSADLENELRYQAICLCEDNERMDTVAFRVTVQAYSEDEVFGETAEASVCNFDMTPYILETPTNLQLNGYELTWDCTEGEDAYYIVDVGVGDSYAYFWHTGVSYDWYEANEKTADLTPVVEEMKAIFEEDYERQPQKIFMRVKTMAMEHGASLESEWSEIISRVDNPNVTVLASPSNFRWEGSTLYWDEVEGAGYYEVEVSVAGGEEAVLWETDEPELDITGAIEELDSSLEDGELANEFKVKVQTCAPYDNYLLMDSDYVEAPSFTLPEGAARLATPQKVTWSGTTLKWGAVPNAAEYRIVFEVNDGTDSEESVSGWSITTDKTSYNLAYEINSLRKSYFYEFGVSPKYLVAYVSAISDDLTLYRSSLAAESPEKNIYKALKPLAAPSNLKHDGYKISWSAVKNAAEYGVYYCIGDDELERYFNCTKTSVDLEPRIERLVQEYGQENGLSEVEISICVTADNYNNASYVESDYSDPITFTVETTNKLENEITIKNTDAVLENTEETEYGECDYWSIDREYSAKAQKIQLEVERKGDAPLQFTSFNSKVKVSATGEVTIPKGFVGYALIQIDAKSCDGYFAETACVWICVYPIVTMEENKYIGAASKKQTVSLGISVKGKATLGYAVECENENVTVKNGKLTVPANFMGEAKVYVYVVAGYYLMGVYEMTVTVGPAIPSIKVTNPAAGTLKAAWAKCALVDGYEYLILKDGEPIIGDSMPQTALLRTGLEKGATYTVRVRSYIEDEENGEPIYSPWASKDITIKK